MQWAKKAEKVYAVLSSDGKLYSGVGQSPIKQVMDDADACMFTLSLNPLIILRAFLSVLCGILFFPFVWFLFLMTRGIRSRYPLSAAQDKSPLLCNSLQTTHERFVWYLLLSFFSKRSRNCQVL